MKSAISSLANFAFANLFAKQSAVNLLNSCVAIYYHNHDQVYFFQFQQFLGYSQLLLTKLLISVVLIVLTF